MTLLATGWSYADLMTTPHGVVAAVLHVLADRAERDERER